MHRILRPSCLSVSDKAAKRVSLAKSRWTQEERTVRDAKKEQVEPTMVAVDTINQLCGSGG